MVNQRRPHLSLIPGAMDAGEKMSPARRARREAVARCIIEVHEIIERMAARTEDQKLFKTRFARHFNPPTCRDENSRRRQMEVALDKVRKFEEEFNAHLRANGFDVLPAEKIVSTVEQIAHSAWQGFRHVFEGWRQVRRND